MIEKFNGLTFDEFDCALRECESMWKMNDAIDNIMHKHADKFREYSEFYMPTQTTTVLRLLSLLMKDTDDWISYWCFEANFGDYDDDRVWDADDEPIPLHTTRALWDFLIQNAMDAGAGVKMCHG